VLVGVGARVRFISPFEEKAESWPFQLQGVAVAAAVAISGHVLSLIGCQRKILGVRRER